MAEYARMLDTVFGPVADDEHWYDGLNFYLNALRDVDRSVELVLDAVEASGQADRTVVVFTADHGEMAGSHGLRQKGNLVYDENFHVPFILSHPDVPGGTRTEALGSGVDLAPTLLECAGVAPSEIATRFPALGGSSLVPVLDGTVVRQGALSAVESIVTWMLRSGSSSPTPMPRHASSPVPCDPTGPSAASCAPTRTTATRSAATSPR
ncbi:sulfatase-like hydrolase/transferase [Streptomyces gardneri]|uniref:sulfatase-like hydrolase/transferase n=1 Tax=Streptomyces gardneri TaxID=66892 RepID=UPI0033ECEEC9